MRTSYFPSTDTGLLRWSKNFSDKISGGGYGITPDQAAQYASIHADFAAAMATVAPNIRNQVAVSQKNDTRDAVKNAARALVSIVRGTTTVSDSQKIDLGITVPSARMPIPQPDAPPILNVASVSGWAVSYRLRNSQVDGVRGKPRKIAFSAVYSFVGNQPPVSVEQCKLESLNTRTSGTVTFPSTVAPGTKVWLVAAWHNAKGQGGPISNPASAYIQFGAMAATKSLSLAA